MRLLPISQRVLKMRFANFLSISILFTLTMTLMVPVFAEEKKCDQNAFDVVGLNFFGIGNQRLNYLKSYSLRFFLKC